MPDAAIPENMQKYENYKEQFKRLNKAMTNGFYLEALFIEYAIMEDRAEAILRYEGNEINSKDGFVSLDRKLRKIVKIAEQNRSLPSRYFSGDLIEQISAWKEERNRLIHALMKQSLTTEELQTLAQTGQALVCELRDRATKYKRAFAKINKEKGTEASS